MESPTKEIDSCPTTDVSGLREEEPYEVEIQYAALDLMCVLSPKEAGERLLGTKRRSWWELGCMLFVPVIALFFIFVFEKNPKPQPSLLVPSLSSSAVAEDLLVLPFAGSGSNLSWVSILTLLWELLYRTLLLLFKY